MLNEGKEGEASLLISSVLGGRGELGSDSGRPGFHSISSSPRSPFEKLLVLFFGSFV